MVVYSAKDWKLEGFRRGSVGWKKVVALLRNKKTDKIKQLGFGQRHSTTFRDLTKVGGDPTHNDEKKRKAYQARHKGDGDENKKWSAGYLSWHFLW